MTYTYFIRKNHLPDSKESYRNFLKNNLMFWDIMSPVQQDQFVSIDYRNRFVTKL